MILAFVELLASPVWIVVILIGVLITALFGSSDKRRR